MKKSIFLSVSFILMGICAVQVSPVFAAERGTPEYEHMKEYKRQQREARLRGEMHPEAAPGEAPGFWEKEAERSGFNRFSAGNFFKNLNPLPFFQEQEDRYNERKAASEAGHASDRAAERAAPQSAVAATK